MTNPRLLIVDDDEAIRTQLKYALRDDFVLSFARNGDEALAAVREISPPLVSLDLGLPPHPDGAEEGLRVLDEILRMAPTTKVLVVTGNGDRANALRAVDLGAFDYHAKPVDLAGFKVVLQRAAYLRDVELEAREQTAAMEASARFEDILGTTPAMREIFAVVRRVGRTDATVLVQGESGTGKELLARAIHVSSPRRARAFVAINCGAIPETLLESELFGHEKGAYTGAHVARKGKVELADGGTLFLDEIGEMSPTLQVKLLRFLQERQIERIGGREPIRVAARVIAATNKDLKSELQAGRFREDLYYRLSVVNIKLPALRDRGEDVVLIANTLLQRSCREQRRKLRFSSAALEAIVGYAWPGNVRELENAVQRAVIMASGHVVEPADLGIEVPSERVQVAPLRDVRGKADRDALISVLVKTKGNISQAAKQLGVSRPTFHGLLDRHKVEARQFK
jgi:two-component system NtrC family response regulator